MERDRAQFGHKIRHISAHGLAGLCAVERGAIDQCACFCVEYLVQIQPIEPT